MVKTSSYNQKKKKTACYSLPLQSQGRGLRQLSQPLWAKAATLK